MSDTSQLSRRHLLTLGAGASIATALGGVPEAAAATAQVPRRVLGKTKQSIPILLLGGGAGFRGGVDPIIKEALAHGVNYIDTARKYAAGASERNAGTTLKKLNARDKTWITSKTPQWSAAGLKQDVALSLSNLNTNYVDLYFLHGLDETAPLDDKALISAVEQLKAQKQIRFFGFSCHGGNVVELLQAAAKRSFVDAVMFRYSFRDYGNRELNSAMDAAHKAGVGLIAMKTQGSEAGFQDAWQKFERTGKWNKYQAVLKAVWQDERISAAVSHMQSLEQLRENMTAAMDTKKLGQAESEALVRYAELTRPYACQGCQHLCGAHLPSNVHVGNTLRSLTYHDSYGDPEKARRVFSQTPISEALACDLDFGAASRACPQGIDIAWHVRRAAQLFG